MATPYLGEIKITSFNFPPKGWAFCNGQTLAINQNQALFAILGTPLWRRRREDLPASQPAGMRSNPYGQRAHSWPIRRRSNAHTDDHRDTRPQPCTGRLFE